MAIPGTAGNDTLTGTIGNDLFQVWQGGNDAIAAAGGNDTIQMGASLTAADTIQGGAGTDVLVLDGDYSAGLVMGSATFRGIEKLEMTAGHGYDIKLSNGNLAAGQVLEVSAYGVGYGGSGHALRFNGSAETDGSFNIADSYGNDLLIGGAQADNFALAYGGADTVQGGNGNDVVTAYGNFGASDVIDGGAGADVLYLFGSYAAPVVLTGSDFKNIEALATVGAFNYAITVQDSTLAAGQWLNIDARSLDAAHTITVIGTQETNGRFDFYGHDGGDQFSGGGGDDLFRVDQGGDDALSGGAGNDDFLFGGALTAGDQIWGGAGYDNLDLTGDYAAGVSFAGDGLAGVERITLRGDTTYKLVFADDNLQAGEAMLIGGGGKVFLDASAESSAAYTMYDTAGNDTLLGGGGDDGFWISAGQDSVNGGAGGDAFLFLGPATGSHVVNGDAGGDIFYLGGLGKAARLDLGAGTLTAGATLTVQVTSVENAYGTDFADTLLGSADANFFSAGGGNDLLRGGAGGDQLVGGSGFDTATYAVSAAAVAVNLAAGTGAGGDAAGDTLAEIEGISGSNYADTLTGDAQANRLDGNGGKDVLSGGGGADTLYGGAAKDTLTGGDAADLFLFKATAESTAAAADVVTDFNALQGDRFGLSAIDANTLVAGDQAFAFIGSAAFSAAGQLRFAGGQVLGDVDGNGVADLVISLTGVVSVTASDFIL